MNNPTRHTILKSLALAGFCTVTASTVHAQIYDVNTGGDNVYMYPNTGGATSANPFILANGYASGLAYSNGNLFVAETANTPDGGNGQNITEFNGTTGAPIPGFLVTNLDKPEGLAIDGSTIYVANRTNSIGATGSIGAYNTTTGAGGNLISGLYQPTDVAAFNGNLYVTLNNGGGSGTAGTIAEFNETTGAPVTSFSATGLAEPQGLTFDNGNLYATSEGNNLIEEFNATTGALLKSFAGPTNPYEIATLSNGDLVVTSLSPGSHVTEYDPSGNVLSSDFLTGSNYTSAITVAQAVPEPSSWMLGGVALVALAGLTRIRRSVV